MPGLCSSEMLESNLFRSFLSALTARVEGVNEDKEEQGGEWRIHYCKEEVEEVYLMLNGHFEGICQGWSFNSHVLVKADKLQQPEQEE